MPTYEYRCKSCSHELEVQQSFTDDPLTECPECSGELRKVFGNIAVTFKGSGFYKTDNRAGSKARPDTKLDKSDKSDSTSESSSSKAATSDSKKVDTAPSKSDSSSSASAAAS